MRGVDKQTRGRRLRERVDIEKEAASQDANGQEVPTWALIQRDVPCDIVPVGGGESIRGRQVEANVRYVVEMRYRTDLTPQHRLTWGTQNLYITRSVDRDGDRRWLQLDCSEDAG